MRAREESSVPQRESRDERSEALSERAPSSFAREGCVRGEEDATALRPLRPSKTTPTTRSQSAQTGSSRDDRHLFVSGTGRRLVVASEEELFRVGRTDELDFSALVFTQTHTLFCGKQARGSGKKE